jgi:hypothetical protein
MRLLAISSLFEKFADQGKLALLLCIAHNWIGDGAAKSIGNDGRGPVALMFGRHRGCL